jgi:2-methylcitrate dehydratase
MNATTHADAPAIGTGVAGERRHRPATRVERLARFVCRSDRNDISEPARDQLKLRLLESPGAAFGALDSPPVALVREPVQEFGGAPRATLIGAGQRSALRSTPHALTLGRT